MQLRSVIDGLRSRTALLGITTPISDIVLPDLGTARITAVVSTRFGIVTVDTTPGAIVRGSGSSYLSMTGTPSQIAAKLATLSYSSVIAGTDQLSIVVLGGGTVLPLMQVPLAVLALTGTTDAASSLVYFDSGTMTLESRRLDGPDLALYEASTGQNATTLILVNSTIGSASDLTIGNDNAIGAVIPRLAIAGRVELDSTTTFAGNGTAVSLALGATLLNEGSMVIDAHGTRFTGGGTFVNDGSITIIGDGVVATPVRIDTALAGTGTITLTAGASLELSGSVGPLETMRLEAGANLLHLARPQTFEGVIAGFSQGDMLVLDGISATSASVSRSVETGTGTLLVFQGAAVAATIQLRALDAGTDFQLGTDATGTTIITVATVRPGVIDVSRFFDAVHGTQLLTQDATERDTILRTRPDLRYEGIGLHAIDPAQATTSNSVDVYRFFDVTNGTHLMTASGTERDQILATRPDLVFEPASTMVEHATAEATDTAVFRFFDRTSGAHFYTADITERAALLATRPDLALEGIAFYAPTM